MHLYLKERMPDMKRIKNNIVPILVFVLTFIAFQYSGISFGFLASEVYTRFIRNVLFTLALILPVACGMGINFAIVVGAISTQMAIVFALDFNYTGIKVIAFTLIVSMILAIIFGMLVAWLLNKATEREMIVSIMIGQISSVMYQFIFMVGYGTIIVPKNEAIMLDRGIGVKSVIDAKDISEAFDQILPVTIGGRQVSLFPLMLILFFTLLLCYIQKTRLGVLSRAVGMNRNTANMLGISSARIRALCIIISTVFAAMSQLLLIADYGTMNVYTGHLGIDTYAAAAILVGGATIKQAKIRNCFIGVLLFHALFITSPLAGQNLFNNPSVGEYFRSFLAYGIIVIAIILNLRAEKAKKDQLGLEAMPLNKSH